MESKAKQTILLAINSLTDNEDHRQELWLHYLSGNSTDTFVRKLELIKLENERIDQLERALLTVYQDPQNKTLLYFLDNFSEIERSIMFLLLLGLSVQEVSKYKGISQVRIRQAIAAIRVHTVWEKYGIKT